MLAEPGGFPGSSFACRSRAEVASPGVPRPPEQPAPPGAAPRSRHTTARARPSSGPLECRSSPLQAIESSLNPGPVFIGRAAKSSPHSNGALQIRLCARWQGVFHVRVGCACAAKRSTDPCLVKLRAREGSAIARRPAPSRGRASATLSESTALAHPPREATPTSATELRPPPKRRAQQRHIKWDVATPTRGAACRRDA